MLNIVGLNFNVPEVYRVMFSMLENIMQKQEDTHQLVLNSQCSCNKHASKACLPRGLSFPLETLEEMDQLEAELDDEAVSISMVSCFF